jgi:hypothetical protein
VQAHKQAIRPVFIHVYNRRLYSLAGGQVNDTSNEEIQMKQTCKKSVITFSLFIFTCMSMWVPAANAVILDTSHARGAATEQRADEKAIDDFLSREAVQEKMVTLGVSPEMAQSRVAALTPAERQLLAQKIDELPAGAGAIEVIGIVFLVLLILELVGVTDIFKRI